MAATAALLALAAVAVPVAATTGGGLDNAWRWLAGASARADTSPVDDLVIFLFASNLAPDTAVGRASLEMVRQRVSRLVMSDGSHGLEADPTLQTIATAYAASRAGDHRLSAALREFYASRRRSSPAAMPTRFSADDVNHLMSVAMLSWMGHAAPNELEELIVRARAGYRAAAHDGDLAYFVAHVVFALSELGRRPIVAQEAGPEIELLAQAASEPRIREDNDLWPEIFLALTLAKGCQPHLRTHLAKLGARQSHDGSWTPAVLPPSSRYHTTSMMFLALLADRGC